MRVATVGQVHFVNLSNGVLCMGDTEHFPLPAEAHWTRIQSTACEQKRWADVLRDAGPDLLIHLAVGYDVVVHDQSERPRVTRACWQGVPWIRYACQVAWTGRADPVKSRNGMDVTDYFEKQWRRLKHADRQRVRYFKKFYRGGPIAIAPCGR